MNNPILIFAPIRGITDRIYRDTFIKYFSGFDYAVAPFVAGSNQINVERKILRDFNQNNLCTMKTIPQILSNNPDDFIQIANALYEMGHNVVNWNLGCPFPMITSKKKGSGLLCYPSRIESFLEKATSTVKSKISIKMRLGFESPDEIIQLIPILNNFPLDEVIIHPRTGKQMYTGSPDLNSFEECCKTLKHSICYNGDIRSVQHYTDLSKRFSNVTKWMIGRGALSNPFLPDEIANGIILSNSEKISIMRKFHDSLFKEYDSILESPSHLMDKMKGEWFYLADFFSESKKIIKEIKKINGRQHYLDAISRIFTKNAGNFISSAP